MKAGITPPAEHKPIVLSIGEPQHDVPDFVADVISANVRRLSVYPSTAGMPELRQAIADWLIRRFELTPGCLDIDRNILPVNGTREALFAFAQCVIEPGSQSLVLMPNPFYQIYEGAAFLAGAQPWFINLTKNSGMLPDFESVPELVWRRCRLIYVCSPGNPTGAVLDLSRLQKLIELSDRFNFVIAADECYSEIYADEQQPPAGLLQAACALGRHDFRNCVVFHSLSKRSSLPGMRSGFVAGDPDILKSFRLYRTYHGCAMSPLYQEVSTRAWADEEHVRVNRLLYRLKFDAVLPILQPCLDVHRPAGGFYLWAETPIDDTVFAREIFRRYNLTVLPGSYLSRDTEAGNPGNNRIRMALVASVDECIDAAERLRDFLQSM